MTIPNALERNFAEHESSAAIYYAENNTFKDCNTQADLFPHAGCCHLACRKWI